MNNITQVHNITSDELTERFLKGVDERINDLKKHFTPKEPEIYLTAKELEKELKISSVTRWEWGKKGILKPRKVGNRTYYLRSEIKELLLNG